MSRKHLVILSSLCLLTIVLRLHTYHEPLERDITIYAVAAHELTNGKTLYSEVWDIKPPLIYWTYELAEAFFGYGELQIYMLNVFASSECKSSPNPVIWVNSDDVNIHE